MGVIVAAVLSAVGSAAKEAANQANQTKAPSTAAGGASRPQPIMAGGTMDQLSAADVLSHPDRSSSRISMPNYGTSPSGVDLNDLGKAVGAAITKK